MPVERIAAAVAVGALLGTGLFFLLRYGLAHTELFADWLNFNSGSVWLLPEYLLPVPGLSPYVAWQVFGALVGAAVGLEWIGRRERLPALRFYAVALPLIALTVLFLGGQAVYDLVQTERQSDAVAAALPGQWVGEVADTPVALIVTGKDAGHEAMALFPGTEEWMVVAIAENGEVTLTGQHFRGVGWTSAFSMDTLTGRLSRDGQSLRGTGQTARGENYKWAVTRVPAEPPGAVGGWQGVMNGHPAIFLLRREGGALVGTAGYHGVEEALTGSEEPGGKVVLKGTAHRNRQRTGSFALDTFTGMLSSGGDRLAGTYKDEAGDSGEWSVARVKTVAPDPVPTSVCQGAQVHALGTGAASIDIALQAGCLSGSITRTETGGFCWNGPKAGGVLFGNGETGPINGQYRNSSGSLRFWGEGTVNLRFTSSGSC